MRLLLLLLLGLTFSCVATDRGYWSFGVTRGVYGSADRDPYYAQHGYVHVGSTGEAGWWLAGILLLPVIVDVVLLPVTVTHDLFWVD